MKRILLLLLSICSFSAVFAQGNQWAWIEGDTLFTQYGIYGTKDVAAAANKPGARQFPMTWTDAGNNLWLFGGSGFGSNTQGLLNDLWKYNASTNQWSWAGGSRTPDARGAYGTKGVADTGNIPAPRQAAVTWKDAAGNLWLFGGGSVGVNFSYYLNDLWKYTPSTGQWTWISGDISVNQPGNYGTKGVATASNMPGARQWASGWTDAFGNFWLWGGLGHASGSSAGYLNDLWKYDPVLGLWTWVSGEKTLYPRGIYGTKGVPDLSNVPGGRRGQVSWTDKNGDFWLFGGLGTSSSNSAYLNDLWKFMPSSGQWTWMSGYDSVNMYGAYGTKGMSSADNYPGARYYGAGWTDLSGNLWLFGGAGYSTKESFGSMNDVWKYSMSTGEWAWIHGDTLAEQKGQNGKKGIAAPGNIPAARNGAGVWSDTSGNTWIFSGSNGYNNLYGVYSDLLKWTSDAQEWTWMSGEDLNRQDGKYGIKGVPDSLNIPGARSQAVSWTDSANHLWIFGGFSRAPYGGGFINDLWRYTPSSRQWTWMTGDPKSNSPAVFGMKGVPGPANTPGARIRPVAWPHKAGANLWLFGGIGTPLGSGGGTLNDLWKYSISTGQWTWMSGDTSGNGKGAYGTKGVPGTANRPASRYGAVTWKDASGNLWLFGGGSVAYSQSGILNDLWKYDPSTSQWTWISGDSTLDQRAVFGMRGVPDFTNKPGARYNAIGWTDAAGNLWLFGGFGYDYSNQGYLADVWKYTISTGMWTNVSGYNVNQPGTYGRRNTEGPLNTPGGRADAVGWTDAFGTMWLFGGNGYASASSGYLNDLWKFNSSTNRWTWVSGDPIPYQVGSYGRQGVADSANKPGARFSATGTADASGNHLWLFGGNVYGVTTQIQNDLWQFTIPTVVLPVQISRFTAQKLQQTVLLNWTTAQEQNSSHFEIEHSADGSKFEYTGTVAARGTSNAAAHYSFTHSSPLAGANFYRLKQVDRDLKFSYSTLVKISINEEAVRLAIVQNPVQRVLQLDVQLPAPQRLIFQVRDINGKLLFEQQQAGRKGRAVYTLSVGHLAKGTYLISLHSAGSMSSTKFVKQ